MAELKLFNIPEKEPPKKQRKPRRKSRNIYSSSENNRRYKLHKRVKEIDGVKIEVRKRIIIIPLGFEIEKHNSIDELIKKFRYTAPTLFTPPRLIYN